VTGDGDADYRGDRLRLRDPALLDRLCDEATFADWEQPGPDLPDWSTSWRHLVTDGTSATLTNPSDANQSRAFPEPVQPPSAVS
jgi:hypothetical protein